jgi:hypothetical protein
MEDELGRARVFEQWGDDDETIQIAIETCPVDCIHYVPYDELVRLEIGRRDQNINFKGKNDQDKLSINLCVTTLHPLYLLLQLDLLVRPNTVVGRAIWLVPPVDSLHLRELVGIWVRDVIIARREDVRIVQCMVSGKIQLLSRRRRKDWKKLL